VKTNKSPAVVIAAFIVVFGTSASAVEVQRPGGTTAAPTRSKAMPLTEGECTGLGGTTETVIESLCGTGKKCVTVDKNGVIHGACITRR
jgi:hypothetical protein